MIFEFLAALFCNSFRAEDKIDKHKLQKQKKFMDGRKEANVLEKLTIKKSLARIQPEIKREVHLTQLYSLDCQIMPAAHRRFLKHVANEENLRLE